MKRMKKHNRSEKEARTTQLSIIPGITVIAVVMAAVFAVLFLLLWRSDNVILYFGGFFSSSAQSSGDGNSSAGELRIPYETDMILSDDRFFTPDFEESAKTVDGISELLGTVRRHDRYKQTFMVSYRSGSPEMVSVLRDGDRYRIESSDVLIVCDGHIVYMRRQIDGEIAFTNRWNLSEGAFSPENEIGIPTFESIIYGVELAESLPILTYDERKKTITLEEITEGEIIRAVTLTYETGMILSAFAETADGEPLAQCRSMFYTMNPEFSADDFLVPMT